MRTSAKRACVDIEDALESCVRSVSSLESSPFFPFRRAFAFFVAEALKVDAASAAASRCAARLRSATRSLSCRSSVRYSWYQYTMHSSCGRYSSSSNPRKRCASIARTKTPPDQLEKARLAHGLLARAPLAAASSAVPPRPPGWAPGLSRAARSLSLRRYPGTNPETSTTTAMSTSALHSPSRRRSLRRLRERLHRYARTRSSTPSDVLARNERSSAAPGALAASSSSSWSRKGTSFRVPDATPPTRREGTSWSPSSSSRPSPPASPEPPRPSSSSLSSLRRGGGAAPKSHADRSAASPGCFPRIPPRFGCSTAIAANDRATMHGSRPLFFEPASNAARNASASRSDAAPLATSGATSHSCVSWPMRWWK
mmetsp:Transcript_4781/g.19110  ORF Transcript_4781/g.19110 Transcript_4781/m.19110 type:complete len:370 (-) Transcript_4781:925-2034(-)